jgi:CBS domain-containing protein
MNMSMNTCGEIMTKQPAYCLPSSTAQEAARLMKGQDVGPIPVVDGRESKKLIGIVTDRDLTMKVVADGLGPSTRIEEVMTREPVACHPDDRLESVLDAMSDNQVRRVPVVDNEHRLVGIISQADVATRIAAPKRTAEVLQEISRPEAAGV